MKHGESRAAYHLSSTYCFYVLRVNKKYKVGHAEEIHTE